MTASEKIKTFSELKLDVNVKNCWIFGAGASVSSHYGIPVQSEMLNRFFQARYPGQTQRQVSIESLKKQVRQYCRFVLPGLDPGDPLLSLEEVFSAYEIALAESRTSNVEKAKANDAIKQVRAALRYATYVHGRGDAKKWKPHERGEVSSPYAELLEKIFKSSKTVNHTTNKFITFNYDICLDRCLINLKHAVDLDLDYGIGLANSRIAAAPIFQSPRPDKAVLLLRTHGALNWIRCDACYSVFTTVNKHAFVSDAQRCWACGGESVDYVLVHPSHTREYRDPIIQLVWGRCQEELVMADRWIFIGYSLPTADVHFRELLRHCIRQREKAGKKTEVLLVGRPQSDGTFINPNVYRNFSSVFDKRVAVWEATSGGFSDFPKVIF
ncbi:hypothetical protein [Pseudomonas sp. LjRoot263]|uniref:hypothetical protein n=1 Tax=Pseudomonas sp. LjRoot263 TaxID=3342302 RepID=UPI003ECCF02D